MPQNSNDVTELNDYDLTQVIRRYQGPVRRYASTVCANAADAEDATQSTFIALLESVSLENKPRALRPWLFAVVRNFCLRMLRAAAKHVSPAGDEDGVLEGKSSSPEDRVMIRAALEVIGELPLDIREVLLRRDFLGQSGPEVAKEMAVSLATVKMRLHKARTHVRDTLCEK